MAPRDYAGCIVAPAGRQFLYAKFYDPRLRRIVKRVTHFRHDQRAEAEAWLRDQQEARGTKHTVRGWAEEWLSLREEGGRILDTANDRSRLDTHILPRLGGMKLDEVVRADVLALVEDLQAKQYAPRTVRNVYFVLCALYRDARGKGRTEANPCTLTPEQIGAAVDAKHGWRDGAVFTGRELKMLLTDPRIPLDRRVQYGLLGLAALRDGEMAGLRWMDLKATQPLARINVFRSYDADRTKTNTERKQPVHPMLQALLAEWVGAWEAEFGEPHKPDDLVLPVTRENRKGPQLAHGSMRNQSYIFCRWLRDLDTLGLRRRRVHDLRRTFISLTAACGADDRIVRWGTHMAPRTVIESYTSKHWGAQCREVAKLDLDHADAHGEFQGGGDATTNLF